MDADLGTLLERAQTAIDQSRRVLSAANLQKRAAQHRVQQAKALIDEDRRAQMKALWLQKRSDRLLGPVRKAAGSAPVGVHEV